MEEKLTQHVMRECVAHEAQLSYSVTELRTEVASAKISVSMLVGVLSRLDQVRLEDVMREQLEDMEFEQREKQRWRLKGVA